MVQNFSIIHCRQYRGWLWADQFYFESYKDSTFLFTSW